MGKSQLFLFTGAEMRVGHCLTLCCFFVLITSRVVDLPSPQPDPARIAVYTPTSFSVFKMLSKVVVELQARGHSIEYIGNHKLQVPAENLGFKFTSLPDFLKGDTTVHFFNTYSKFPFRFYP